jgi:hypothetical protein
MTYPKFNKFFGIEAILRFFLGHNCNLVSYSDRLLSVRLSVCSSVRKLLHFRLLLQNHWANFNQTCTNFSIEGDCLFPRGDNSKRVKIR